MISPKVNVHPDYVTIQTTCALLGGAMDQFISLQELNIMRSRVEFMS